MSKDWGYYKHNDHINPILNLKKLGFLIYNNFTKYFKSLIFKQLTGTISGFGFFSALRGGKQAKLGV